MLTGTHSPGIPEICGTKSPQPAGCLAFEKDTAPHDLYQLFYSGYFFVILFIDSGNWSFLPISPCNKDD
jgi:hypothetical protein